MWVVGGVRWILSLSAGAVLALGCGDTPPEPVSMELAPQVSGEARVDQSPSHGGQTVAVGGHVLEVVVHEGGQVYAYPPADEDLDDDVTVIAAVPTAGGVRRVPLRWHAGEARFQGRLRRVEVTPGPVEVTVEVGGHTHQSEVHIDLAPAINVRVEAPARTRVDHRVTVETPMIVLEGPRVRVRGKHKHRKHRMRGKHRVRGGHGGGIDIRIGH